MKHVFALLILLSVAIPGAAGAPATPDSTASTSSTDTVPARFSSILWEPSPLSYGLFVGTGPRWTLGRLNEYFSWAWDFTFGAQVAWHRFRLEGSISFASPTLKKVNLTAGVGADQRFRANVKNANYTAYGFHAGYAVVDRPRVSVAPFIGGMYTRYSWTSRPLVPDASGTETMGMPARGMHVADFNLTMGINIDWHFSSAVVYGTSTTRQQLTSSLRFTPYAIRGVYSSSNPTFHGWQFGLMIGYSATTRKLKAL